MAQHILVIEYEPRYIQRIEEAAAGSSLSTTVARTGDEAIQALPGRKYDLIVLSTIIPRYSTAQLIRSIRNDSTNASTPILLTTSGYSGTDPRSDAVKLGASDMLVKPYAPPDFVQRVTTLLNLQPPRIDDSSAAETVRFSPGELLKSDLGRAKTEAGTVERPEPEPPEETAQIPRPGPSVEETHAAEGPETPPEKRRRTASDSVDRLLADTLAGVKLPSARKRKRTSTAAEDLDKMLENTLSGLETPRPKVSRSETSSEETPRQPAAGQEPPMSDSEAESQSAESFQPKPEVEEDPFPDAAKPEGWKSMSSEPEPDEPPFEGVEDRPPAEARGTTLVREEEPPEAIEVVREGGERDDASRFGQYVLLEKIATGGMAEVWKARMRGLEGFEKIVAIKKILPHLSDNDEFTEMFVDEAKLAAQLNHNNIIHIYDLGKIDESWFIAMEYIDGYDLKSLIARGTDVGRPLPIPLSLFIASKVASALGYAHRKKGFDDQELGLVHRDVSPQNVLISREGDIKLCDFGIAKAATKASHTQAGALKGKLQYMSPEQAWGRHIDHRSDIFAAAAVLFEMLAGRKLFSGDSELSVLDQVREAHIPSPSTYRSEVPAEIDDIVLKALEKEPSARFQTAGDMARAIDSILNNYKPAPTSADLAMYVAAIDEPDTRPMPSMPAASMKPVALEAEPAAEPEAVLSKREDATPVAPLPVPERRPVTEASVVGDESIPIASSMLAEDGLLNRGDTTPAEQREAAKKKSRALPIAIAAVLILATIGAGAVMMMRSGGEPGGPQVDASAGLGVNPPVTDPVGSSTAGVEDLVIEEGLTPEGLAEEQLADVTATGLRQEDLALIDQTVRDRIDVERRRLERERESTAAEPSRPVATSPPPRQTAPPSSAETESVPPPAPTTTAGEREQAPSPVTDTKTPVPPLEPAAEQPAPSPPPRPAIKRGDLVEPGTPGLKEPEIISLKRVTYPLLAKRNRVEGLVIIRALISEEGRVLEAELLRGVNQNVGINEAALDMVRGGRFEPAWVGDVAVRAWKTIPIPFKME